MAGNTQTISARGLSNTSQLLLRNRAAIADDRVLLVNPPADGVCARLTGAAALTLDYAAYLTLKGQSDDTRFGLPSTARSRTADRFRQVVIFLTKAKARTRLLLDYAASVCAPDGLLWLIGEKHAGIASAGRLLADAAGPVVKRDAARHCMLFETRRPTSRTEPFSMKPYWRHDEWCLGGQSYPVASLPGVFSHQELDPGTAMLLQHLIIEGQPEALDFGSGCGIVAALLGRGGARVTAVDADALAIEATTRTLTLNGLQDARVIAADGISGLARFELIVSNPPFHQGTRTATATAIAHEFITASPKHLRPGGRLVLVANTFLDYPRVLKTTFGGFKVLAEDRRYRVYEARPRAAQP